MSAVRDQSFCELSFPSKKIHLEIYLLLGFLFNCEPGATFKS